MKKNQREKVGFVSRSVLDEIYYALKHLKFDRNVIIIGIEQMTQSAKLLLRKTISNNPDDILVLVSSETEILAFGTGLQVFHLIDLNTWYNGVKGLRYKMNYLVNFRSNETVQIHLNGEKLQIVVSDICCIKGEGNYCSIYTHNHGKLFVTMRMKEAIKMLESFNYFFQVNRSYLLNVNRVSKISQNIVSFRSRPNYKLKLGYRSIKKLKDEILWA